VHKNRLTVVLLALLLGACDKPGTGTAPLQVDGSPATASAVEDTAAMEKRLDAWFAARFEEELDFSPMTRTQLGDKKDYDKFDDASEAAEDAQLAWRKASVDELKSTFDYAKLGPEARTSWDVWVYQYEEAAAAQRFRSSRFLFNQMQGVQAFLPSFLINYHRVDEPADMDAWIARVGGVSRHMNQLVDRAEKYAAGGVRPPRFAYEGVIEQASAVIAGAPFGGEGDAPLYADAKAKIAALEKAGKIDAARAAALTEAAAGALKGELQPAYQRLIAFVEKDLPNTDAVATGVHRLPDGAAYYAERLARYTTTDMSAEQIHEFGLAEVARIHAEMEKYKETAGFKGSLQELFRYMREDDRFYFPDTDAGREAYLQSARDHYDFVRAKLPEYFGLLPRAPLEVRRVEAFREQKGGAQHYYPSSPDGSRPGVYYAHLADMRAMPKHQLEVVAYHEGIPGHHMQIAIAQELGNVPTFRTQAGFTAYIEGWALYSELLANEMGAYDDPYSQIGRLSSELWRAIRLVVDTGVHAKGWTEQQALDYFIANSPSAEGAIRSEIRRYLVIPGQATAYKIGMQRILDLREEARAALGAKFDIRAFHDVVLGGGSLPLPVLERRVDEWVERTKAAS
jgi:uncharacterized protein (DUF885 family)